MPRYQMRQDMFSIGDDWWIEDHDGNKAFRVDGKAMHVRDTDFVVDCGELKRRLRALG